MQGDDSIAFCTQSKKPVSTKAILGKWQQRPIMNVMRA